MKKQELLEIILRLQDKVNTLEDRVKCLESNQPIYPSITWPSVQPAIDQCSKGGQCEYPFPWHATTPAPCKKCGTPDQFPYFTFTSTGATLAKCSGCGDHCKTPELCKADL